MVLYFGDFISARGEFDNLKGLSISVDDEFGKSLNCYIFLAIIIGSTTKLSVPCNISINHLPGAVQSHAVGRWHNTWF